MSRLDGGELGAGVFFITDQAANRVTFKVEYLLPGDKEVILGRIREILA